MGLTLLDSILSVRARALLPQALRTDQPSPAASRVLSREIGASLPDNDLSSRP